MAQTENSRVDLGGERGVPMAQTGKLQVNLAD